MTVIHMTRQRLLGVVVMFGAAVTLTGCGGGSHSAGETTTSVVAPRTQAGPSQPRHAGSASKHVDSAQKIAYERAMKKLGGSLGAFLASVGAYDQSVIMNTPDEKTAVAQIVVELRKAQVRLQRAATQLHAIKPPAEVRSDHDALTKGVTEYATELGSVIALVRSGNLAALGTIASLKGVTDMQRASQAITRKGYAIL